MTAETATWLEGKAMDPNAEPIEPLPAFPGFPFLHTATGAVMVGPTGSGRSTLLQAGMYDAAAAGKRCVYLGSEVGEAEFPARAAILAQRRGDTINDEMRGRLALVRYLDLATTIVKAWADPASWVEGILA